MLDAEMSSISDPSRSLPDRFSVMDEYKQVGTFTIPTTSASLTMHSI